MTINDLELETFLREVHKNESKIDYLTREGKASELLTALAKVEDAARQAQWRLLHIRFPVLPIS